MSLTADGRLGMDELPGSSFAVGDVVTAVPEEEDEMCSDGARYDTIHVLTRPDSLKYLLGNLQVEVEIMDADGGGLSNIEYGLEAHSIRILRLVEGDLVDIYTCESTGAFVGKVEMTFSAGSLVHFRNFNGDTLTCDFYLRGKGYHRPFGNGPAKRIWTEDGVLVIEGYMENNLKHRPAAEGPAWMHRGGDGTLTVGYFEHGLEHRPCEDGPSLVARFEDGSVMRESYCFRGVHSRPASSGPSSRTWHYNGVLQSETFCEDGLRHRPHEDGPAFAIFNELGGCTYEAFYKNGKWSRPPGQGPACIWRDSDGMVTSKEFYLDGEKVTDSVTDSNVAQTIY